MKDYSWLQVLDTVECGTFGKGGGNAGKGFRGDYTDPTLDLVSKTREIRLDWAKDLLQADKL